MHQKLPSTRWLLPNAPFDTEAGTTAWFKIRALPSQLNLRVLGQCAEDATTTEREEDEEGILKSVAYLDSLIDKEVEERGISPERIVVGGFSQGCAMSMIWGLIGRWRDQVGGIFGLSGYLPSISAVEDALKKNPKDTGTLTDPEDHPSRTTPVRWFFAYGTGDMAVPMSLFTSTQERLRQRIDPTLIEGHIYPGLGHTIAGAEIRDIWLWMSSILEDKTTT